MPTACTACKSQCHYSSIQGLVILPNSVTLSPLFGGNTATFVPITAVFPLSHIPVQVTLTTRVCVYVVSRVSRPAGDVHQIRLVSEQWHMRHNQPFQSIVNRPSTSQYLCLSRRLDRCVRYRWRKGGPIKSKPLLKNHSIVLKTGQ